MLQPNSDFHSWLVSSKGFGVKSSRDVLSRLKRLNGIVDLNVTDNAEKILYMMSICPAFKICKQSIKSQLRRAVKLYKEYTDGSKSGYALTSTEADGLGVLEAADIRAAYNDKQVIQ